MLRSLEAQIPAKNARSMCSSKPQTYAFERQKSHSCKRVKGETVELTISFAQKAKKGNPDIPFFHSFLFPLCQRKMLCKHRCVIYLASIFTQCRKEKSIIFYCSIDALEEGTSVFESILVTSNFFQYSLSYRNLK